MKREHLYVSGKHPCVWLTAFSMAASAAAVLLAVQGTVSAQHGIWCGIVLPCVAAVGFALTVLCAGGEMLHRTAVPVWIWGICLAIQSGNAIIWIGSLLFCFGYARIMGHPRVLLYLCAMPYLVGSLRRYAPRHLPLPCSFLCHDCRATKR